MYHENNIQKLNIQSMKDGNAKPYQVKQAIERVDKIRGTHA